MLPGRLFASAAIPLTRRLDPVRDCPMRFHDAKFREMFRKNPKRLPGDPCSTTRRPGIVTENTGDGELVPQLSYERHFAIRFRSYGNDTTIKVNPQSARLADGSDQKTITVLSTLPANSSRSHVGFGSDFPVNSQGGRMPTSHTETALFSFAIRKAAIMMISRHPIIVDMRY
jgi:hypothetical protein